MNKIRFNGGINHQIPQLLQGLIPGLLVARAGSNHHVPFDLIYRGISTFYGNPGPLIVIDGIPATFLENIDPGDVQSISLLNDPTELSAFGARAGAGVLVIETGINTSDSIGVQYSGSIAIETPIQQLKPLDASAYRKIAGATNLGADTDWPELVSKNGHSNVHRLGFSGATEKGRYQLSLNLRNMHGIAYRDFFRQLSGRLALEQKLFKENIAISLQLFSSGREGSPGDPNTFRYALNTNPTLPVMDTTSSIYGGFSQRQIFDSFNPVAINAQNEELHKYHALGSILRSRIKLGKNLNGNILWSGQQLQNNRKQYSTKTSLYGGGYSRNGFARIMESQNMMQTFEAGIQFNSNPGRITAVFSGHFFRQNFSSDLSKIEAGDFLTDAFTFNNLGAALDITRGKATLTSHKNTRSLNAFFTHGLLNIKNIWEFSGALRYEGASQLGRNTKWDFYPAVSSKIALVPLIQPASRTGIFLRTGFSVTGNLPQASYLSLERYAPSTPTLINGTFRPTYVPITNANADLGAERTISFDAALDFIIPQKDISFGLATYRRNSRYLILPLNAPIPPNPAPRTWINIAGLNNSGIEAYLNIPIINRKRFVWKAYLNLSTNETLVQKVPKPEYGQFSYLYQANIGGPGVGTSELLVPSITGQGLGILWGPVWNGIQPNGSPSFKDLNGDGRYCYCDDDHTVIGNGLPRFTAGLQNFISIGNLELSIFLRAVQGHQLLNTFRLFYENTASHTLENYNIVKTKFFDPALKLPGISDHFIEDASFLEIHNVRLSFRWNKPANRHFREAQVFITGQQVAILSPFTGISPEVRLPGTDLFAPGIERRDTYWPTRTFSFGVSANFR